MSAGGASMKWPAALKQYCKPCEGAIFFCTRSVLRNLKWTMNVFRAF